MERETPVSGKPDGERAPGDPGPGPRPEGTRVRVGRVEIGGPGFVVMAGPCAVEGMEQTEQTAAAVAAAGAHVLRGGVFKPRTSPYSFQGMGEPGLRVLAEAARKVGLPIVSEVMETSQIPLMEEHVDILQVGARNMQNFSLLRALGKVRKPVLLKRGLAATVQEWLLAAEYILDGGNDQVHPVRARHPHLRDGHAQHVGPVGGGAGEAAHAPAGHRGPVARHGRAGARFSPWRWRRWRPGRTGC